MSIETDFRAALAARTALTALVGDRIAQDAVPEGAVYPLVVYSVQHQPVLGLGTQPLGDQASVTVQVWGNTGAQAAQVADEVQLALAAANPAACATVLGRRTVFDEDLGLDGVVLDAEWWE